MKIEEQGFMELEINGHGMTIDVIEYYNQFCALSEQQPEPTARLSAWRDWLKSKGYPDHSLFTANAAAKAVIDRKKELDNFFTNTPASPVSTGSTPSS